MDNCRVCGVTLGSNNWYGSSIKNGQYICKSCTKVRSRESAKKYTNEHILFFNAQQRARRKNLEFNLELSDIIIPEQCPIYGVPLERATGSKGAGEFSPTLDRKDSTKGYVKGNVEVISWKANRLKSNGTIDDFKAIIRWLEG